VPALRQPRGAERAGPAEPAPRRALQDAPRLREGAPQRLRRRGHPGRGPGPPARRLSFAALARHETPESGAFELTFRASRLGFPGISCLAAGLQLAWPGYGRG